MKKTVHVDEQNPTNQETYELPDPTWSADPAEVGLFLLDACPFEQAGLEAVLARVITASGGSRLCLEVEAAALAYAREVADRAFDLGLELGKMEGHKEAKALAGARKKARM